MVNKWNMLDELGMQLGEIETYFVELNLGVEAWVPMNESIHLGFFKTGDVWRLCINGGSGAVPIRNASVEIRAMSVDHLTELEYKLKAVFGERQAAVQQALDSAKKWIAVRA
jgi:hypothetical protein